ncbi:MULTISPECIES: hypothetical protein [Sphingobacterium]|uniref:hypothetical protein n=1 Tax=Sphingobacterium TaxID=28453 RepID=UPI00257ED6E9|nr:MULTISPECIES: hypothetical protein [Sphingobacterium]
MATRKLMEVGRRGLPRHPRTPQRPAMVQQAASCLAARWFCPPRICGLRNPTAHGRGRSRSWLFKG